MPSQDDKIPICTLCSSDELLPNCSAVVALHPDEATGEIVQFAIENKKLFIVVPCCVFSRLFPFRFKPGRQHTAMDNQNDVEKKKELVSTYNDLIEYLVDKDDSIRVTKLDFEGANLALWSTYN